MPPNIPSFNISFIQASSMMIECGSRNQYYFYEIRWDQTFDVWFIPFCIIILHYIYILYVILSSKSRIFKSAYFIIFAITGVADVVNAITAEYIRFSQRVGMGPCFGLILQAATAITGSNFAMHLIGNLLMTLFQFTAVWLPMIHSRVWKTNTILVMMILMIIVPVFVYSHLLFTEFEFKKDRDGKYVYSRRFDPITKTRILDSALTITQSVICTIMSIATVIGIRIKTAEHFYKNIPEKASGTLVFKRFLSFQSLVLIELLNAIFGMLETMYSFIFLFNISPDDNIFTHFVYSDFVSYFFLMITLNAFTLPLLSANLRREIASRWWNRTTAVLPFVPATSFFQGNNQR